MYISKGFKLQLLFVILLVNHRCMKHNGFTLTVADRQNERKKKLKVTDRSIYRNEHETVYFFIFIIIITVHGYTQRGRKEKSWTFIGSFIFFCVLFKRWRRANTNMCYTSARYSTRSHTYLVISMSRHTECVRTGKRKRPAFFNEIYCWPASTIYIYIRLVEERRRKLIK